MMDYRELRKLKAQLIEKENKTEDELHLLMELQSLSKVIDTIGFYHYRCREMCVNLWRPLIRRHFLYVK